MSDSEHNPVPLDVEALRAEADSVVFDQSTRGWRLLNEAADEIERLRAEVAQLLEIRFSPTGDNHHNAAMCPYCNPTLESMRAQLALAEELLAETRTTLYNRLPADVRVHRERDLRAWNLLNRIDAYRSHQQEGQPNV